MTDRMDALVAELRTTAPAAPAALRARVDATAAREPASPPTLRDRLRLRRLVIIAAPAALTVMLGIALAHGVTTTGSPGDSAVSGSAELTQELSKGKPAPGAREADSGQVHKAPANVYGPAPTEDQRRMLAPLTAQAGTASGGGALRSATTPPPAKQRAQDYRASLTIRVRSLGKLSDATKTAIRVTRAWGGYVVSANYAVPGENGESTLTLRIPVQHVQAAIQRFSDLGTLAAQDISIRDVQGQLDTYTRDLFTIRERIAKLRAQLTDPNLSAGQRASLELQVARARKAAANLRAERTALAREASFATISLTLTTRDAAAAAPHHDSRVERMLRDAASVLALELALALYGLIVAAPLALLAALAFFAARLGRRRADDRLLGRT
jgi:uncharacterized protein DUF4349